MGIVTGKFENVNQMQTAVKTGGIIDGISSVLNYTINKIVDKGKIPYSVGNVIKSFLQVDWEHMPVQKISEHP